MVCDGSRGARAAAARAEGCEVGLRQGGGEGPRRGVGPRCTALESYIDGAEPFENHTCTLPSVSCKPELHRNHDAAALLRRQIELVFAAGVGCQFSNKRNPCGSSSQHLARRAFLPLQRRPSGTGRLRHQPFHEDSRLTNITVHLLHRAAGYFLQAKRPGKSRLPQDPDVTQHRQIRGCCREAKLGGIRKCSASPQHCVKVDEPLAGVNDHVRGAGGVL